MATAKTPASKSNAKPSAKAPPAKATAKPVATPASKKAAGSTAPRRSPRPGKASAEVTHERIAARAHEISRSRDGSELDHWLAAERELRGA